MAILKTITTVSPIVDSDGVNAFGWLRVRPNAPFEYNDGSNNISVTDAIIECQLQDGAIYAVGGVVSADLSLAPNTGASNTPETYYIVDLELNGTTDRQYWRIASSTGGAGSVDVEYVNVPRVPGPDNGSSDTLAAHLAATNPHTQYVLRADTVAAGGTTTGAASDGLGKIPRCNTTTGDLDASVLPVSDLISQVITNGVTTKAPSEDAVYDALALRQPLDGDLTAIAAISPSNDDVIQRKSGAWTNRTMAQLATDIIATTQFDAELAGLITTQEQGCEYSLGGTTDFDTSTMAASGDVDSISDVNSVISGAYRVTVLVDFLIVANGAGDFDLSAASVSNCSVNNILSTNVTAQGYSSGAIITRFLSFNVVPTTSSPTYKVTWANRTAGVADFDLVGSSISKIRIG